MLRAPIVTLLAFTLLVAACAPAQTTLEGTACPQGQIPLELGGCCADADADDVCDLLPEPTVEQPVRNVTPENVTAPVPVDIPTPASNETSNASAPIHPVSAALAQYDTKVKSYTYYLDTPQYGELWVWHEAERDEYITVEDLLEVRRNRLNRSTYSYDQADTETRYLIEDRSLPVVNYVLFNRTSSTYTACYVPTARYALTNCIDDFPNGTPIIYGGVRFTPPRDPIAWLRTYENRTPERDVVRRHNDNQGRLIDVRELTFREQNGDLVTFLLHITYGAPLKITVVDRYGKTKEGFAPTDVVCNSNSQFEGDPRLEPGYEYR